MISGCTAKTTRRGWPSKTACRFLESQRCGWCQLLRAGELTKGELRPSVGHAGRGVLDCQSVTPLQLLSTPAKGGLRSPVQVAPARRAPGERLFSSSAAAIITVRPADILIIRCGAHPVGYVRDGSG
jgi:hypothetical protein